MLRIPWDLCTVSGGVMHSLGQLGCLNRQHFFPSISDSGPRDGEGCVSIEGA